MTLCYFLGLHELLKCPAWRRRERLWRREVKSEALLPSGFLRLFVERRLPQAGDVEQANAVRPKSWSLGLGFFQVSGFRFQVWGCLEFAVV